MMTRIAAKIQMTKTTPNVILMDEIVFVNHTPRKVYIVIACKVAVV